MAGHGAGALSMRGRRPLAAAILVLLFAADALAIAAGLTAGVDHAALVWLRRPGDPGALILPHWTFDVAVVVTTIGSGIVRAPVAIGGALWLAVSGRRREALVFAVGVASAAAALPLVKLLFDRARPDAVWQLVHETRASFPSGHAMGAAATYPLLGRLLDGRVWLWAGIALALAIGCSRVFLGVHWLSDVVGGWALGAAWACGTAAVLVRPGARPGLTVT